VEIANGGTLPVALVGVMRIPVEGYTGPPKKMRKFSMDLVDSLLVPGIKCTLISPKALFRRQGIRTYFNDELFFQLPDGTVVGFVETARNYTLYLLDDGGNSTDIYFAGVRRDSPCSDDTAHNRLAHFGWARIDASHDCTIGLPVARGTRPSLKRPCQGCIRGGARRVLKKRRPKGKYTYFGQCMASDICTMPKSTPFGFTGMLCFYDLFSRFIALYYIREHRSSEVIACMKQLLADHGHDMKNGKVDTWFLDNDSVFTSDALEDAARELVTRLRYISPWNPWQNVSETAWRIILRPLRICLAASNASEACWPFAANQIVRIHNGLATLSDLVQDSVASQVACYIAALTDTAPPGTQRNSPYFLKTGKKSDFTHIRTLFCAAECIIRNSDDLRRRNSKISPITQSACHLGIDDRRNGYFMYLLQEQRFTTFAFDDCYLTEDSFPVINKILGEALFDGTISRLPSLQQQMADSTGITLDETRTPPSPTTVPPAPIGRDGPAAPPPGHCSDTRCTLPYGHSGPHSFERVTFGISGPPSQSLRPRGTVTYSRIAATVGGFSGNLDTLFPNSYPPSVYLDVLTSESDPYSFYLDYFSEDQGATIFPIYFSTACFKSEPSPSDQPRSLREELEGPNKETWVESCLDDIRAKLRNKAFELVEDEGQIRHKTKFALTYKFDDNGTLKCPGGYRARWVGCGYTMKEGRDFPTFGNYTATPAATTVRGFGCFIMKLNLFSGIGDVIKAFTLATLPEPIFVEQPYLHLPKMAVIGSNGKPKLAKCIQSLEGLPPSGHLFQRMHITWFKNEETVKRDTFIFTQSTFDPCFLVCHMSSGIIGVLIWVDDLWLAFSSDNIFNKFIELYKIRFPSKFSIGATKFVGLELDHKRSTEPGIPSTLSLGQTNFIHQTFLKYMPPARQSENFTLPATTDRNSPLHYSKLSVATDKELEDMKQVPFLACFASILFSSVFTRADISLNMSVTGQFMQRPTKFAWEGLLQVLGYADRTRFDNIIRYSSLPPSVPRVIGRNFSPEEFEALLKFFKDNMGLHGWCDASWLLRSIAGYFIMCCNGLLDWRVAIIRVICGSSAEAEVSCGSFIAKRLVFIRNLFNDMTIKIDGRIPLCIDSTAAEDLAHKEGVSKRTAHFLRWQYTLRWMVVYRYLILNFVFDHEQLANLMTKPVSINEFRNFCKFVFNYNARRISPTKVFPL
jgi:hypothetical protein